MLKQFLGANLDQLAKSPLYSIVSTNKPPVSAEMAVLCPDPNRDEFLFTHLERVAHGIPVFCAILLENCSPSFTCKTGFPRSSV